LAERKTAATTEVKSWEELSAAASDQADVAKVKVETNEKQITLLITRVVEAGGDRVIKPETPDEASEKQKKEKSEK